MEEDENWISIDDKTLWISPEWEKAIAWTKEVDWNNPDEELLEFVIESIADCTVILTDYASLLSDNGYVVPTGTRLSHETSAKERLEAWREFIHLGKDAGELRKVFDILNDPARIYWRHGTL